MREYFSTIELEEIKGEPYDRPWSYSWNMTSLSIIEAGEAFGTQHLTYQNNLYLYLRELKRRLYELLGPQYDPFLNNKARWIHNSSYCNDGLMHYWFNFTNREDAVMFKLML